MLIMAYTYYGYLPSLYSVKADLYVVDRLQILTKFAVLALMYSAALPVPYLAVHHNTLPLTPTPTLTPIQTRTPSLTLAPTL